MVQLLTSNTDNHQKFPEMCNSIVAAQLSNLNFVENRLYYSNMLNDINISYVDT